jgi:hypothetical protein
MNELTNYEIDIVREDGEFVVSRVRWGENLPPSLLFSPALERPTPASLAKLERSYALRDELDSSWAARPVALVEHQGRPSLLIEGRGGEFLDKIIDGSMASDRLPNRPRLLLERWPTWRLSRPAG